MAGIRAGSQDPELRKRRPRDRKYAKGKGYEMKYMVNWQVHDDKRHDALQAFTGMDASSEPGFGDLNVIGRWHDVIGFTGTAIVETDDFSKLSKWLLNWNNVCDIEAIPVYDDAETRALGRDFLGS